jgi:transcriptional regulator with XRE-family HTH domain
MELQRMRKARQMSQAQLAEAVGVTQGYISHLELGMKKNPSIRVLSKIAKALDVPVEDLICWLQKVG